jgi:hypothetical protein
LLHPLVVALAGLGLALWAYRLVRRGRQALLEPQSVIWVWTLGYLGLLFLRVNTRTHRALLPVVPFLLVLAANAARQAIRWAGDRMSRRHAFLLTAASMLVVLGLVLPPALQRLLAFRRATIQRVEVSPAVEAGEWLEAHFPTSTRVLYDPYSYVPPAFADARITPWGGTPELLEQLRPDVVMVYTSLAADFRDAVQAGAYAREDAEYLAKHEYYRTLRSGEAGYALQRDFGIVQVYVRRSD